MKTALTILFIIICIAMVCLVVAQEGKEAGLGTISGMADTYWSKNKGRSLQGKLLKATTVCCVLFFVVAVALSLAM
ncbi:MAG: preprotein translocase subunit SecG [Lachnospiraceae bacterium]|nr:preprotein translocase subunit SecG [Lachnospiraceae bacterium]